MQTRREMLISTITGLSVTALGVPRVNANEWHSQFSTLNFGVVSSENEADRIARYQAFVAYLERRLQVGIKMHQATDYAGTIEDLKGKSLAFADPNSTSAFVAPSYFLREQGIDPQTFFGRTGFSGSHENGIIAVLNDTYDAAATSWTNEERSNVARMELKGMIPKGQIRYVWKSPPIPNGPWAMHTDLPRALKSDIHATLVALPTADPAAWKDITDGKSKGVEEATHTAFEPIIRMIKDNQRARRDAKSN